MSAIDEVVGEFLVESYESLDRYDDDLLALERDPADVEVLSGIFRTIHTIKGTCGFFGFTTLQSVAHVGENLLGRLRDGELPVTAEIASALLATGDAVRGLLGTIEATGEEGDADHSELIATLERLYAGEGQDDQHDRSDDDETGQQAAAATTNPVATPDDDGVVPPDPSPVATADAGGAREPASDETASAVGSLADTSIRVDVGLLDDLMNLVGELVLARNQIVQLVSENPDDEFLGASQRLNLVTTELQEGVVKTRMQPIGNVWNKLPRVVRDLALTCGKQVDLVMQGKDTELDKSLIEAIKDPLTHLVRNAVDHGIESPEGREVAGKPATGRLVLRAYHESGQVNIEIADDGAGIDLDKLKAKAVDSGAATAEQVAEMGEREALHLIFAPGLSTAPAVTNVSGRGVGMDVVRTNIERIGGTVDVTSEPGAGTTFRVKIPLTLAIVPALVVTDGGERYAIPQLSLIELVRLDGEDARSGIELVHGAPVYRLRGRLLPIVYLDRELGRAEEGRQRDVLNVVVLHADGQQFGLVVDEINDTQEIVVKALGPHLKDVTLFAGATIMGDGRVALILDVLGIAQRARVVSEGHERAALGVETDAQAATDQVRRSLLLVGVGNDRRAAVALSEVSRLEEFAQDAIEWAGGREVVQYRDAILPLLRLGDALGVGSVADPDKPLDVVVHRYQDRQVGLVVDRILDAVDEEIVLDGGDGPPGLLGSAVIQGRVTDVVDVDTIVATTGLAATLTGAA